VDKIRKGLIHFMETGDDSVLDKVDMRPLALSLKTLVMLKGIKKRDVDRYKSVWLSTYENIITVGLNIRKIRPGKDRAMTVHNIIDSELQLSKFHDVNEWEKVKCKKGCSGCCKQKILVTDEEAELLRGRTIINKPDLKNHNARCMFLAHDGECSVYNDRPSVCRLLVSKSDPKLCETGANRELIYTNKAEVVSAAYFNAVKKQSTLPEAMERINGNNI